MQESLSSGQKNKMVKTVTYASALGSLFLALVKMIVGVMFHSSSILVDAFHSLTDLGSDFVVLWAAKFSHIGPDTDHPYGHARFETLATIMVGSMLIGVGCVFMYDNVMAIIKNESKIILHYSTYLITIISIVVKELLYHYQMRVGRLVNSQMVIANAWHSRTDAISSLLVLIGLFISAMGYVWMDNMAAAIVAVLIGKVGYDFVKVATMELLDTGVSEERIQAFKNEIMSVPGVLNVHNLRSRLMGQKVFLDVNVEVNPRISVSEGHEIVSWVAKNLIDRMADVEDVTVHADVEDDGIHFYARDKHKMKLGPLRPEVEKDFYSVTQKILVNSEVERLDLHYVEAKVLLELYLASASDKDILSTLESALKKYPWFLGIKIWIKV